ncbi:MAG: hypothetical protein F4Z44_03245, partial [Gemmatimonadetes bacterium]|nr:hypothetical protein [Gemmatimonadota bacterium]
MRPTSAHLPGFAAPALFLLAFSGSPSKAAAQSSNGDNGGAVVLEAVVLPAAADIDLDGRIDEDIWSTATPITDFTQQEPVEGGIPSERTEVRVVFDEDNLYISAVLYGDPADILAY